MVYHAVTIGQGVALLTPSTLPVADGLSLTWDRAGLPYWVERPAVIRPAVVPVANRMLWSDGVGGFTGEGVNGTYLDSSANGTVRVRSSSDSEGTVIASQIRSSQNMIIGNLVEWPSQITNLNLRASTVGINSIYDIYARVYDSSQLQISNGQVIRARCDLGFHVRNTNNSGFAPLAASSGTFSGNVVIQSDASNRWVMDGQALQGTDLGLQTINISRAYGGQVLLTSAGAIRFTDGNNLGNVEDAKYVRHSTAKLGALANNGLAVRNFANTADAPITVSDVTASGSLSTQNGFVTGHVLVGNGSIRIGSGVAQNINGGGFCSTSHYGLNGTNATGAPDVLWTRGATGQTADARADGGLRVRNLANTADAPISASVGNFTTEIVTPRIKASSNGASQLNFYTGGAQYCAVDTGYKVVDSGYFGFSQSSSLGGVVDALWTRGATGPTVDVRADGGLRVRNLADTGHRPIIASAYTFQNSNHGMTSDGFSVSISNNFGTTVFLYSTAELSRMNFEGFSVSSGKYIGFANNAAAINAYTDAILTRNPTGPSIRVQANGGLQVRNLADTADAPITAGNILTTGNIQLGGTTASFPMLKRSGAALHVKVADDSAFAQIVARDFIGENALSLPSTTASHYMGSSISGLIQMVPSGTSNPFVIIGTASNYMMLQANSDNTTCVRSSNGMDFVSVPGGTPNDITAGRVRLGGKTSSFPMIKNSSGNLQVRRADDSDFADLTAKNIVVTGALYATSTTAVHSIGSVATGVFQFFSGATGNPEFIIGTGTNHMIIQSKSDGENYISSHNGLDFRDNTPSKNFNAITAGSIRVGGKTSSFPMIKNSGSTLKFRLADDTADATITAGMAEFSGQCTWGSQDATHQMGNPTLGMLQFAPGSFGFSVMLVGTNTVNTQFAVSHGDNKHYFATTGGVHFTTTALAYTTTLHAGKAILADGIELGYNSVTAPSTRFQLTAAGNRVSQVGNGSGIWQDASREEYNAGGVRHGFYGVTPVARQGVDLSTVKLSTIATALNSLGLVETSGTISDPIEFLQIEYTEFGTTNYYFGGNTRGGNWVINRYNAADASKTTATIADNPGVTTLADAWTDRATLTYS